MCARFTIRAPAPKIAEAFGVALPFDIQPRYNVAPTQDVLAIRLGQDGRREAARLRWGLVPAWAQDVKIGNRLMNARAETIAEKPSFRSAFKARRRCLIVADGFYEWRMEGKNKQPFHVRRPAGELFAFAGLWERWDGADTPVESCTILTTGANAMLSELHDRMPVILTTPAEYEQWLTAANVTPLLRPLPDDALSISPANPYVNNSRNEGPECIAVTSIQVDSGSRGGLDAGTRPPPPEQLK
jgi:putative SOS response-associated peptidase YedK